MEEPLRVYCSKLPQAAVVKNLPTPGDARDTGSIPGLGRSPGVGNGNPLQCSCLDNAMDRGTWRATVHGVAKSQTQLSTHTHTHTEQVQCGWKEEESVQKEDSGVQSEILPLSKGCVSGGGLHTQCWRHTLP